MLEDESGRIQLGGKLLSETVLVTGVIMAALGLETAAGEFEIMDLCFPGMAPQASIKDNATESSLPNEDDEMEVDGKSYLSQSSGILISIIRVRA